MSMVCSPNPEQPARWTFAAAPRRRWSYPCRSTSGPRPEENFMLPKNLRYATSHEWAALEGDICTVGITAFAVEQLTDVVFVELNKVGSKVKTGDKFGVIESVKAVSDLYAPVDGEIV